MLRTFNVHLSTHRKQKNILNYLNEGGTTSKSVFSISFGSLSYKCTCTILQNILKFTVQLITNHQWAVRLHDGTGCSQITIISSGKMSHIQTEHTFECLWMDPVLYH